MNDPEPDMAIKIRQNLDVQINDKESYRDSHDSQGFKEQGSYRSIYKTKFQISR